ncbi:ergothioneine biosynthesis protein EgtB [Marinoscillum sp.]|uniref:ergothioneine biosynthesis protein EgtB n=1 Tax=Marinoscillum sp. TaxID=2024838 RepID=UPI003BAABB27
MPIPKASIDEVASQLIQRFQTVRDRFLQLVEPLEIEDFVVQPVQDVSPPKWHLAHTTWFFEVFVLVPNVKDYQLFHPDYPYLFNSYYVAAGDRWTRAERGFLTRPTVKEIMNYRAYVEEHMLTFLSTAKMTEDLAYVMEIGLQHEQQHQELFLYDIKYILGHNPLFPAYKDLALAPSQEVDAMQWLSVEKGNYSVGYDGNGFCFDNELGRHEIHLEAFEIADRLVTNGEFFEFIHAGGYENHEYWLSEGWDWVNNQDYKSPMYWIKEDNKWMYYTLGGLKEIDMNEPVAHVSFYEADAYARWTGYRLPTEFEWEVACQKYEREIPANAHLMDNSSFHPQHASGPGFYGNLWEWTSSAYQPYPYYRAPDGALGEYNGKFMVNQKVLRGGSFATPKEQIRYSYRNFFHPHLQWLFAGIRLSRHI